MDFGSDDEDDFLLTPRTRQHFSRNNKKPVDLSTYEKARKNQYSQLLGFQYDTSCTLQATASTSHGFEKKQSHQGKANSRQSQMTNENSISNQQVPVLKEKESSSSTKKDSGWLNTSPKKTTQSVPTLQTVKPISNATISQKRSLDTSQYEKDSLINSGSYSGVHRKTHLSSDRCLSKQKCIKHDSEIPSSSKSSKSHVPHMYVPDTIQQTDSTYADKGGRNKRRPSKSPEYISETDPEDLEEEQSQSQSILECDNMDVDLAKLKLQKPVVQMTQEDVRNVNLFQARQAKRLKRTTQEKGWKFSRIKVWPVESPSSSKGRTSSQNKRPVEPVSVVSAEESSDSEIFELHSSPKANRSIDFNSKEFNWILSNTEEECTTISTPERDCLGKKSKKQSDFKESSKKAKNLCSGTRKKYSGALSKDTEKQVSDDSGDFICLSQRAVSKNLSQRAVSKNLSQRAVSKNLSQRAVSKNLSQCAVSKKHTVKLPRVCLESDVSDNDSTTSVDLFLTQKDRSTDSSDDTTASPVSENDVDCTLKDETMVAHTSLSEKQKNDESFIHNTNKKDIKSMPDFLDSASNSSESLPVFSLSSKPRSNVSPVFNISMVNKSSTDKVNEWMTKSLEFISGQKTVVSEEKDTDTRTAYASGTTAAVPLSKETSLSQTLSYAYNFDQKAEISTVAESSDEDIPFLLLVENQLKSKVDELCKTDQREFRQLSDKVSDTVGKSLNTETREQLLPSTSTGKETSRTILKGDDKLNKDAGNGMSSDEVALISLSDSDNSSASPTHQDKPDLLVGSEKDAVKPSATHSAGDDAGNIFLQQRQTKDGAEALDQGLRNMDERNMETDNEDGDEDEDDGTNWTETVGEGDVGTVGQQNDIEDGAAVEDIIPKAEIKTEPDFHGYGYTQEPDVVFLSSDDEDSALIASHSQSFITIISDSESDKSDDDSHPAAKDKSREFDNIEKEDENEDKDKPELDDLSEPGQDFWDNFFSNDSGSDVISLPDISFNSRRADMDAKDEDKFENNETMSDRYEPSLKPQTSNTEVQRKAIRDNSPEEFNSEDDEWCLTVSKDHEEEEKRRDSINNSTIQNVDNVVMVHSLSTEEDSDDGLIGIPRPNPYTVQTQTFDSKRTISDSTTEVPDESGDSEYDDEILGYNRNEDAYLCQTQVQVSQDVDAYNIDTQIDDESDTEMLCEYPDRLDNNQDHQNLSEGLVQEGNKATRPKSSESSHGTDRHFTKTTTNKRTSNNNDVIDLSSKSGTSRLRDSVYDIQTQAGSVTHDLPLPFAEETDPYQLATQYPGPSSAAPHQDVSVSKQTDSCSHGYKDPQGVGKVGKELTRRRNSEKQKTHGRLTENKNVDEPFWIIDDNEDEQLYLAATQLDEAVEKSICLSEDDSEKKSTHPHKDDGNESGCLTKDGDIDETGQVTLTLPLHRNVWNTLQSKPGTSSSSYLAERPEVSNKSTADEIKKDKSHNLPYKGKSSSKVVRRTIEIVAPYQKFSRERRKSGHQADKDPSMAQPVSSSSSSSVPIKPSIKPSMFFSSSKFTTPAVHVTKQSSSSWLSKMPTSISCSKKVSDRSSKPRRSSTAASANVLSDKILAAKMALKTRNFQSIVQPGSMADTHTHKHQPKQVVDDVDDVDLPSASQILDKGLPLLNPVGVLVKKRKSDVRQDTNTAGVSMATASATITSVHSALESSVHSNTLNSSSQPSNRRHSNTKSESDTKTSDSHHTTSSRSKHSSSSRSKRSGSSGSKHSSSSQSKHSSSSRSKHSSSSRSKRSGSSRSKHSSSSRSKHSSSSGRKSSKERHRSGSEISTSKSKPGHDTGSSSVDKKRSEHKSSSRSSRHHSSHHKDTHKSSDSSKAKKKTSSVTSAKLSPISTSSRSSSQSKESSKAKERSQSADEKKSSSKDTAQKDSVKVTETETGHKDSVKVTETETGHKGSVKVTETETGHKDSVKVTETDTGHKGSVKVTETDTGHKGSVKVTETDTGHKDSVKVTETDTGHKGSVKVTETDTGHKGSVKVTETDTGHKGSVKVTETDTGHKGSVKVTETDTGHKGTLYSCEGEVSQKLDDLKKHNNSSSDEPPPAGPCVKQTDGIDHGSVKPASIERRPSSRPSTPQNIQNESDSLKQSVSVPKRTRVESSEATVSNSVSNNESSGVLTSKTTLTTTLTTATVAHTEARLNKQAINTREPLKKLAPGDPRIRKINTPIPGPRGKQAVISHPVAGPSSRETPVWTPIARNAVTLKLEHFLAAILKWNSNWFEEYFVSQQTAKHCEPPPVQGNAPLYPLVQRYTSYNEYSEKFMIPLLLCETWAGSFNDWRENRSRNRSISMKVFCGSISKPQDKILDYVLHGLMNGGDFANKRIREGDLAVLHLTGNLQNVKDGNIVQTRYSQLVYVDRVFFNDCPVERLVAHNAELAAERRKNSMSVKLLVKVRWRSFQPIDRVLGEIQTLSMITSPIRQFKAMASLPRSPLCRDLLMPNCTLTYCDKPPCVPLVLQSNYNPSQALAIATAAHMVSQPYVIPRVCMLQGPPGTGKSHTILGIISQVVQNSKGKARICLCAQSNAAIDELVKRLLKQGSKAGQYKLKIVRIGNPASVSQEVMSLTLQKLIEKNIHAVLKQEHVKKLPTSLQGELTAMKYKIDAKRKETQTCAPLQEKKTRTDLRKLENELQKLEKKMNLDMSQIRPTKKQEQELKFNLLQNANIIAGTLNSIGGGPMIHHFFQSNKKTLPFDCVIVDEATQATELDNLVPLQFGASKLVLVGDPEQLPPTVISQLAAEHKFGLSLMERLFNHFKFAPVNPVILLDTQYRMDPEICSFPNNYVYDGRLKTDRSVLKRSDNWPLKPYLLFDIKEGKEKLSHEGGSLSNLAEAQFTVCLCQYITQNTDITVRHIGIIAPYQNQKNLLQNQLQSKQLDVEVSTVDSFQGREKHVIIMSCVRAQSSTGSIGFVGNRNRMNVSLTRAKCSLYVVGHIDSLRPNDEWSALIQDAEQRSKIKTVYKTCFLESAQYCLKSSSENQRK